jgi:hypothetical protein
MFRQLISGNYADALIGDAMPTIIHERLKTKDIFDCILKFSFDSKLLISNVNLLLGKQLYWEFVEIYATNADMSAKQLIKQLCEIFDKKFVLKIIDNEDLYVIEYNLQRICTIATLKLYKQYSINEFIAPIEFMLNDYSIQLMPPLLEVIYLYSNLYNPKLAEDWPKTLNVIQQLEVFIDKDLKALLTSFDKSDKIILSDAIISDSKQKNIKPLLLELVSNTNYLLLDYTLELSQILTIISKNTIEYDFQNISNYLTKFVPYGIIYHEQDIYIHRESLMKRYLFYITYNSDSIKKKHILTLYNNLSYELINYYIPTEKSYKIVDPITELRFIYINIWDRILLQRTQPNTKFKKDLTMLIAHLKHYKKLINIYEYKQNYTGIYIDINIKKKIKALSSPKLNKYAYYCYEVI